MVEIIEHLKPIGIIMGILVGIITIIGVTIKATNTYRDFVQQIEGVETKLDTFISKFDSDIAQMEERIKHLQSANTEIKDSIKYERERIDTITGSSTGPYKRRETEGESSNDEHVTNTRPKPPRGNRRRT